MKLENDQIQAIKNYCFGFSCVGLSLADITQVAQCVAAVVGAIILCRQLWKELKK